MLEEVFDDLPADQLGFTGEQVFLNIRPGVMRFAIDLFMALMALVCCVTLDR